MDGNLARCVAQPTQQMHRTTAFFAETNVSREKKKKKKMKNMAWNKEIVDRTIWMWSFNLIFL